ncbi:MAG: hypoxanthine phosphoribosyltransferase [Candidatus Diapherotrites archaeon]
MKIVNNFSKTVLVPPEGIKLEGEEPCVRDKYKKDIERVLISKGCLRERVKRLASEVASAFEKAKEVNCVVVLKGGMFFASDLMRLIDDETDLKTKLDFIQASSYYDTSHSCGKVTLKETSPLEGDHILLIEDVVDTGTTLSKLQEYLRERKKFFKTCVLLDKGLPKAPGLQIDFIGFKIPNEFVAGYGLDYAGRYRGMPDVVVVNKKLLK